MSITSDCGDWTLAIETWPWPRLYFLRHYILGVAYADYSVCQGGAESSDSLVLFEMVNAYGSWVAFPVCDLGTPSQVDNLDIADFGPFYIISANSTRNESFVAHNYQRDVTASVEEEAVSEISDVDVPTFVACCNFRGQLVVGGITSSIAYDDYDDWENLSRAHVAWSGVGKYTFRPEDDPTAGFCKAWWSRGNTGRVIGLHSLGERVVVLGDLGLMYLEPYTYKNNTGFANKYLKGTGIDSSCFMAGDENVLFFLNWEKDLCMTSDGAKVEVLGYREFFEDMDYDGIVMSYVPQKKRLFISDGYKCYCLTEHGMYSTHQLVNSAGISGSSYLGFFLDSEDYEARLETNTLDFSQRGKKTLETVEAGIQYVKSSEEAQLAVKYKNDYSSSTFTQTSFKQLNPSGFVFPIVTADEFRIVLKAGDYREANFNLSYLKGRVKMVDKRSIRGLYNAG